MDNNQEKDYRVFNADGTSYVITSAVGGRLAHEFFPITEQRRRAKVRALGLAMAKAIDATVTEMQVEVALESLKESGHNLFGARIYPRERFMPVRPDGEITAEDAQELARRLMAGHEGDDLSEESRLADKSLMRRNLLEDIITGQIPVTGILNPGISDAMLHARHLHRSIDPAVEPHFEYQVSKARHQMAERGSLPWLRDPLVLTGMEGHFGTVKGTVKEGDEFYHRKIALGYVPVDKDGKQIDLKEFMESEEGKRIIGDATLRAFPIAMSPVPRMDYLSLIGKHDPSMDVGDELNAFLLESPRSGWPHGLIRTHIRTAKAPIKAGYLTQDRTRSALNKVHHLTSAADQEKFNDNVRVIMELCYPILNKVEEYRTGWSENDCTACIAPVSESANKRGLAWFRPTYVVLALAMIRNNKGLFRLHPAIKSEDDLAPIVVSRKTLRDFPVDYIYASIASLFFCEEIHTADPEKRHTEAWWDKLEARIFTHICAIDPGAISDEGQAYWRNMIKDESFRFRQEEGVFAMQEDRQTAARQRAARPFSDRQLKEPKVWAYNWVWSMVQFMPTPGHEMYEVDKKSDKFWNWLERRAEVRCEEKMAATATAHGFTPGQVAEYATKFKAAIAAVLPEARKKFREE